MLCSEQHEPASTAGTAASRPSSATLAAAAAVGASDGALVVGALANSYAAYQLRLSARLAREHAGLRWGPLGFGLSWVQRGVCYGLAASLPPVSVLNSEEEVKRCLVVHAGVSQSAPHHVFSVV
jgi:hypothetical protein